MEKVQYNAAVFRSRPLTFILFFWLVFPLIYWFIESKANKIVLEGNILLYEVGILSKERTEIPMDKIRTVKVIQSFSERIFGAGNLEIYTTGDNPEIVLEGFPAPNVIKSTLQSKIN